MNTPGINKSWGIGILWVSGRANAEREGKKIHNDVLSGKIYPDIDGAVAKPSWRKLGKEAFSQGKS